MTSPDEARNILPPTGERTGPGLANEEYWFSRHVAAYAWCALRLTDTDVVIDAGAGEGYGPAMLPGALRVALDYDAAALTHLARTYPPVRAVAANLVALPVADQCADAVLSLQVLEHLWDAHAFLRETARVLRAGGVAIVTTPNRLTFSPGLARGEKPTNPFHVEEFDADQVTDMLQEAGFVDVTVHGLHHGPRLTTWESTHGSLVDAQVAAITSGEWPAALSAMVASVTPADFTVTDSASGCADLVAIGYAP